MPSLETLAFLVLIQMPINNEVALSPWEAVLSASQGLQHELDLQASQPLSLSCQVISKHTPGASLAFAAGFFLNQERILSWLLYIFNIIKYSKIDYFYPLVSLRRKF